MAEIAVQLTVGGANAFDRAVGAVSGAPLTGLSIRTVQVNIGLRCNLACHHCHVESGPLREEAMDWATMQLVLDAAGRAGAGTLDITGGAPEMHPRFRDFVGAAIQRGLHVMVRTNLTILLEEGYTDLSQWMAERKVQLVASLPCYLEENVTKQRGRGVYAGSIEAIRRLNAVGYGRTEELELDLVYNPVGTGLPPDQGQLEADYRRELHGRFGIVFTHLFALANLPIGRFLHDLQRQGKSEAYAQKLLDAFNPATLEGLMCRHQLHVGWDGRIYDCDFNFAINLPAASAGHIRDFDAERHLARMIQTGAHCFGCTAGAGSSCGGALA